MSPPPPNKNGIVMCSVVLDTTYRRMGTSNYCIKYEINSDERLQTTTGMNMGD